MDLRPAFRRAAKAIHEFVETVRCVLPAFDQCEHCGELTDEEYITVCERCHLTTCGDCLGEFNACKTCLKEELDATRM